MKRRQNNRAEFLTDVDRREPGCVDPDAFANSWVGTPFRWDGRDRKGVDCWGLVWRFYFDCLGVTLPDWTVGDLGADYIDGLVTGQLADHWRDIDPPGNFALVVCPQGRRPAHVGVIWRGGVLHSLQGRGVVWEALGRFRQAYPNARFGEYVE